MPKVIKNIDTTISNIIKQDEIIKYEIYGRQYKFAILDDLEKKSESPKAYCITNKKWCWILGDSIFFEGESVVPAKLITN